jgi:hypothetical protein
MPICVPQPVQTASDSPQKVRSPQVRSPHCVMMIILRDDRALVQIIA